MCDCADIQFIHPKATIRFNINVNKKIIYKLAYYKDSVPELYFLTLLLKLYKKMQF